ncbi:MAG: hypothetical protein GTO62_14755 [Planctomycetales bacterium]|nr:hypothetical protein [Planctomycetales bacterium]NIP70504.1 hypothetical protein [Planctomycetales bacterium]
MTCVLGTNLQAEDPAGEAEGVLVTDGGVSLSEVQPTPEMWFYVQERRRHDDPRTAVRRKAEYRAQQRQQRIAAMKAFGESKQRPRVEHSVFYSLFTTRNDGGWPVIWPMGVIGHYQSGRVPGDSGSP